jgi:hypothetical protein
MVLIFEYVFNFVREIFAQDIYYQKLFSPSYETSSFVF